MTAQRLVIDATGSDDLADLIGFVQDGVGWRGFDRARERFRKRVERRALRVLRAMPPRRPRGAGVFRWSYDRERQRRAARYFFAHHPNGYERTETLIDGWSVRLSVTRAGLAVEIANDVPYASRVYQTDAHDQIPGHAETDWPDVRDIFLDIATAAETMLNEELDAFIAQELNR